MANKRTGTVKRRSRNEGELKRFVSKARKTIRGAVRTFGLTVPGVGGSRLIRKATRALKKVNRGY